MFRYNISIIIVILQLIIRLCPDQNASLPSSPTGMCTVHCSGTRVHFQHNSGYHKKRHFRKGPIWRQGDCAYWCIQQYQRVPELARAMVYHICRHQMQHQLHFLTRTFCSPKGRHCCILSLHFQSQTPTISQESQASHHLCLAHNGAASVCKDVAGWENVKKKLWFDCHLQSGEHAVLSDWGCWHTWDVALHKDILGLHHSTKTKDIQ